MSLLLESLNEALDNVQMASEHYDKICAIIDTINQKREELKQLEIDLCRAIDSYSAELAKEIRYRQPRLLATIKSDGCEIGYRTKSIFCKPEPYDDKWNFTSTTFGSLFQKRYPNCQKLSCPLPELAAALAEYFMNNYRSLS